jgi:hypothetical protein
MSDTDRTEEDKIYREAMVAFDKDPESKDWLNVEDPDNARDTAFAWFESGYKAGASSQQKKIEELEKENRELIEDSKMDERMALTLHGEINRLNKQIESMQTKIKTAIQLAEGVEAYMWEENIWEIKEQLEGI